MPGPTFVFAFVLATMIGAVFHLLFGGNARRLAVFLLAGWLGFATGQIAGHTLGIELFSIGQLRVIPAITGSIFGLVAALIMTSPTNQPNRRQ